MRRPYGAALPATGPKGLRGIVTATYRAGRALVFVTASDDDADRVKASISTLFNRYMILRRGNAVVQLTGRLSQAEQKALGACVPG
jgi:hypothetical protein